MTPEQLAATAFYVDQFAAQIEQLEQRLAAAFRFVWAGFDAWYDDDIVDDLARQMVDVLLTSRSLTEGMAQQYASLVLSEFTDQPTSITPGTLDPPRGGVDLAGVYRRPVEMYRRKVATGTDPADAEQQALDRAAVMGQYDLAIASRDAQLAQYETNGVTGYRRVVHPELSRTGSCGLCIVASDRIYRSSELMPLHARCKCETVPIVGADDPGGAINSSQLADFYAAAGSNRAEELKATRYKVDEHGELGPTLNWRGDSFKGPRQVKPLEEDPKRARKMLEDARPVLERMQNEPTRQDALDYQRRFVVRLEDIIQAA